MKRLVIVVAIALVGLATTNAQNIEIDRRVDIDIRDLEAKVERQVMTNLDVNVERLVESLVNTRVNVDFGYGKNKSKYQQTEQEMEIPLSKPGEPGKLILESHNGRVTITGYDGATVKVKMIKFGKKISKDKDSKNGMRLIGTGGANVEAEEYNNTVEIEKDGWNGRMDFVIQVPRNFDIEAETYNNGHIWVEDIHGEVNVESYNGPITLTKIKGSASASTYNGAIEVDFTGMDADTPMAFNTYNGNVDLTVPAGTKITAKMKTNRDIFTDFESFSLNETRPSSEKGKNGRGYRVKYENWIEGNLNGGGPNVTMKTTNGNIYIRKGN